MFLVVNETNGNIWKGQNSKQPLKLSLKLTFGNFLVSYYYFPCFQCLSLPSLFLLTLFVPPHLQWYQLIISSTKNIIFTVSAEAVSPVLWLVVVVSRVNAAPVIPVLAVVSWHRAGSANSPLRPRHRTCSADSPRRTGTSLTCTVSATRADPSPLARLNWQTRGSDT